MHHKWGILQTNQKSLEGKAEEWDEHRSFEKVRYIPGNLDSHAHAQKGPENVLSSLLWFTLRSAQVASEGIAEL